MILLLILFYILLFVIALALFILISPINYGLTGLKTDKSLLQAEVFGPLKWYWFVFEMKGISKRVIFFKLFGISIKIGDGDKKRGDKKKEKEKKKEKVKAKKEKRKSRSKESGIFKNRLFKKSAMMAEGLFKNIRFRHLEVEGRFGFEDPYHTGLACALINCIKPHHSKHPINLTPVFDDEVCEGHFAVKGSLVLGVILWLFVKIFLLPYIKDRIFSVKKTRDGADTAASSS